MRHFQPFQHPVLKTIAEGFLDTIPKKVFLNTNFLIFPPIFFADVPHFKNLIDSIKPWTDVDEIIIIVVHPLKWEEVSPIHIDGMTEENSAGIVFNIPILNCDESYTISYKVINQNPIVSNRQMDLEQDLRDESKKNTHPFIAYDDKDVEQVGIVDYKNYTANFLHTGKPHKVMNLNKKLRVLASVRWKPSITWTEVDNFLNTNSSNK